MAASDPFFSRAIFSATGRARAYRALMPSAASRLAHGDIVSSNPRRPVVRAVAPDTLALVGGRDVTDATRWPLVDAGGTVRRCESLGTLEGLLSRDGGAVDYVVVDVEGCGGIAKIIDGLLALRLGHPELPVLLASREVQSDDLSTVRLAIADATVKLPLSQARLTEAMASARENNLAWQARLGRPLADRRVVQ